MPPAIVKYHTQLQQVMTQYKGQILTTSQITSIFKQAYPHLDIRFMQPSDHCINHTNQGACDCSLTQNAIFKYIQRGLYLVL
jgi:hypothetical protein